MLTQKQKRFLRSLAHPLHPLLQIGNRGITGALIDEADHALVHHELVKIRLQAGERDARQSAAEVIAERTNAEVVQLLGRVLTLYRTNPELPTIELPRA
jgi:RNA-binding protein